MNAADDETGTLSPMAVPSIAARAFYPDPQPAQGCESGLVKQETGISV